MTPEGSRATYAALSRVWSWRLPVERALVLSPAAGEVELVAELWPRAAVVRCGRGDWDLDSDPVGLGEFGLVLACNVFMCSRDPIAWLRRIHRLSPVLVLQDLTDAWRGEDAVADGDVARYHVPSRSVAGRAHAGQRLWSLDDGPYRVADARVFPGSLVAVLVRD